MPVAPIGSSIWKITSRLHDQFREEIGWPNLARSVANVYHSLPIEEREHTGILAGNYGEAGALNLYGPALGLPHAMGLTNSFWYRGYDPRLPQTVIVAGFDLEEGRKLFGSCLVAAKNTNLFGVENEESRDHPDILLSETCACPGLSTGSVTGVLDDPIVWLLSSVRNGVNGLTVRDSKRGGDRLQHPTIGSRSINPGNQGVPRRRHVLCASSAGVKCGAIVDSSLFLPPQPLRLSSLIHSAAPPSDRLS
jgi:hypothetical protein